jgi:hypothetical protein
MSHAEPSFAPYASIAAALEVRDAHHLTVVGFIDRWAPHSFATAVALEAVRSAGEVAAFANIFLVDATAERDAAHEYGVLATPALLFFWDGEQAIVRRPAWEDDNKYCGVVPAARLAEMIRHARDCCVKQMAEGAPPAIGLDF